MSSTDVSIFTVTSVPRYGPLNARGIQENALHKFKLKLNSFYGVFWGQHMQKAFEQAAEKKSDWILTIDYDTLVSAEQLDHLFTTFGSHPEIDALAALQVKRDNDGPLLTMGQQTSVTVTHEPLKVTTAHFGLTLLRVDRLEVFPKPWFHSEPDAKGSWEAGKLDDDIYFWHHWRRAGNNIYVDPLCNIGHLEETVAFYDENLEIQRSTIPQWRDKFLKKLEDGDAGGIQAEMAGNDARDAG